MIRRVIELTAGRDLALPSFSSRTLVYKGMLTAPQLPRYFPDLRDPRLASRIALVHSRFSTNTFPSWELAHPFRMIAHNGEVNTLRGNVNWTRARESQLASELFGDDLQKVLPVVRDGGSDSATFDNVLELLVLSGRSIPHAMMMMIPEAYRTHTDLDPDIKGFYDFHSCLMEPWDGPAAVAFTDGRWAGAALDRNGLRPGRWVQDTEGYVVLASETGVITVAPEHVQRKGRLAPGKLFLLDLDEGRIVPDEEVKRRVARRKPYGEWYQRSVVAIDDLPEREPRVPRVEPLRSKQLAFGYSQEDLKLIIAPMASKGEEPVASMGNDAALAVLSDRQPPLFSYFKQLFAQVTNPPVDPIRENVVMSLHTGVGAELNLLAEVPEQAHQLGDRPADPAQPSAREAAAGLARDLRRGDARHHLAGRGRRRRHGGTGCEALCDEAAAQVDHGANILILSDRNLGPERVAIPSLLAVAAVHHHLVRAGTRLRTGLVIESGEPRDIHHMATLIGYGASAINPYLMFESLEELAERVAAARGPEHRGGRRADRQGDRQGPAEDDLEDGDLDDPVLLRRADLRGGRPRARADRPSTSPAPPRGSAASASTCSRPRRSAATSAPTRGPTARCSRSAASCSGGATASATSGTRTRSRACSTPSAPRRRRTGGAGAANGHDGNGHAGNGTDRAPQATREPQEIYDDFARQANDEATRDAALRGLMRLRSRA